MATVIKHGGNLAQQAARRDGLYLFDSKANVINPRVITITKIAIHPKGSSRNFMSLGLSLG
jgi:hypothetical protein